MPSPPIFPNSQRIECLDALRGFALLGIFLSIINGYNFSPSFAVSFDSFYDHPLSGIWGTLHELIISQRFIAIFSFLFGVGVSIQLANFEKRKAAFLPFFLRRMLLLAGLGLINTTFFFWGEILFTYAIFGLLLVFFFKAKFRFILGAATLIYVLIHPIWVVHFSQEFGSWLNPIVTDHYKVEDVFRIYREGSLSEMINLRWREYIALFTGNDEYMRTAFSLILLGFAFGRFGHLKHFIETIRERNMWLVLSGSLGGILSLFTLATGVYNVSLLVNPPVAITLSIWRLATTYFYIHLFILLFQYKSVRPFLHVFPYPGRMSLTNYMLAAFIYALIYHNPGLGLYAQMPMWTEFPIAVGLYSICLAISWKWLSLHRFGPLEWIWRSFSYGQKQPILKKPTSYTQP